MSNADRRRHSRVEVQLAAELDRGGTKTSCTIRDLSIGGAFIATAEKGVYGEAVVVHTRLPGIDRDVPMKGTVRWVSPDGCGVQFEPLGARETHAIVELTKPG